ncbi:MAG: tetratricopeptide repeat protein [Anaerolineales bacterium]|nr:tetratricopeptide repeat protein [Anaerolineales bacterium]
MLPVTVHPLVPDFILQQFRAGVRRGQFTGVGMFVDISGFSNMTDTLMAHGQHGAEVLATVMRNVFTPLIQTVHEHEGFIATLAGDAFTALFPFERMADAGPVCAEAIQAAWEIQQQMALHAAQVTPYGTYPVSAKMGVAVGEAVWGILTSEDEQRATYFFRGSAVEECAEAEHAARAGEIILDAVVCQNAPIHAQVEPYGEYFRLTSIGAAEDPDTGNLLEWGTMMLPPGPGDMVRFFPEILVTQEHTGEFRQVVNLFIQLPTIRAEDELKGFMQAFFTLQERYGGLLNRVDFGDKGAHLLVFWGAPISYQNDIGRALNFILKLQTLTSLPLTAGLTYRISHAGFIGSPLREEFTCYGRGVNLAARFMTAAPRGEIWADEEISRRVANYFELKPLGARAFKGFSEPQPVYQLLERKEQTASSYQGAFVGREAELAQLEAFIGPAMEGRFAGVMVIRGEAGIGKSRLVSTLQVSASLQNHTHAPLWALCQNDQILQEALNPFRYWLRQYCHQSTLESEAKNKQHFSEKLDELVLATHDPALVNELERTRSFLGALLDLRWPGSLYEQLEGPARLENTLTGLATLIQAESLRQPIILLLEDVQWLDADSRTFLSRFARTLMASNTAYPIAILATYRAENTRHAQDEMMGEGVAYQELVLKAFGESELAHLGEVVLGAPIGETLLGLLVQRAEGNPFFAEQILRYLKENGDLQRLENGHICVRQDLLERKKMFLPTDVRVLLVARLDQLARELRDLVQAAAVLGQEFEVRVLMGMLREEKAVEERIKKVEEEAIWTAISQLRYLFRHALLRDAAYRMQVRVRRQRLHRMAVESLEQLYFENLAPHYGTLGYHAERAGLNDKARGYLQKAGDAAREAYQNSEAVDYYTHALAVTPEEMAEKRFDILVAREDAFFKLGNRGAGTEDLTALWQLAEESLGYSQQAKIALLRSRFFDAVGDYEQAIETAQTGLALAETSGDQAQLGHAFLHLGTAFWWQGKYAEADKQAQQALKIFDSLRDDAGRGDTYYLLGETATSTGNYTAAETYLTEALKIFQKLAVPGREASLLNDLGLLMSHQQKYMLAETYHAQSLEIYNRIGDRKGIGKAVNNIGVIHHVLGAYAAAQQAYSQALFISRESGDRQEEAIALNNLGEVLLRQEIYEEAQSTFEKALAIERELGIRYFEAHTLSVYGETLLARREQHAAGDVFRQVMELRKALGQDFLATAPNLGLAQVAAQRGDKKEALHYLDEALAVLEKFGANGYEDPLSIYWGCYALLKAFDDPRAGQMLQTTHTLLLEQVTSLPDEQSRAAFLQNIATNRKILEAIQSIG